MKNKILIFVFLVVGFELSAQTEYPVKQPTQKVNNSPWYGLGESNISFPDVSSNALQLAGYYGLLLKTGSGELSLLKNGNLGVGVSNPLAKLSVNGFVKIEGNDGRLMLQNSEATSSIYFRNTGTSSQRKLEILYGPTVKYVMDNNGNVGIGETTPDFPLQIRTPNETVDPISFGFDLTRVNNNSRGLSFGMATDNSYAAIGAHNADLQLGHTFNTGSGGQPIFYPDLTIKHNDQSSGKVGIGTTNPTTTLDVNGVIKSSSELQSKASNPGLLFDETDVANKNWHLQVNGGDFKFYEVDDARATWSQKMVIKNSNGRVGIGTTNPIAKLDVAGKIAVGESNIGKRFYIWAGGTGTGNHMRIGTDYGHYGDAVLELYQDHFGGSTQNPGKLVVNGNLGVGTTTTGSHRLAVEGSIGAREVKVEASGWSDFVFYPDYELRTLEEVEEYIEETGHLPEIPSEAEVMEQGIQLGEMNAKLLQKIEELTLYLIEQNKQNQSQQAEIEELRKEIKSLKEN